MKPIYRRMLRGMQAKAVAEGGGAADWHLYVLRCGDGSLYTGITTDIERRFRAHQEGKAARYTKTHGPVGLVYREACGTRSQALSRECAVKSLKRHEKEDLIAGRAGPKPDRKRTARKPAKPKRAAKSAPRRRRRKP
jgi:predicted GIY-YIG superfamily endonuclease